MALDLEIGIVANPQSALAAFDSMRGAAGAASSAAASDFERLAKSIGLSSAEVEKLNASFSTEIARGQLLKMGADAKLTKDQMIELAIGTGMSVDDVVKRFGRASIETSSALEKMALAAGVAEGGVKDFAQNYGAAFEKADAQVSMERART